MSQISSALGQIIFQPVMMDPDQSIDQYSNYFELIKMNEKWNEKFSESFEWNQMSGCEIWKDSFDKSHSECVEIGKISAKKLVWSLLIKSLLLSMKLLQNWLRRTVNSSMDSRKALLGWVIQVKSFNIESPLNKDNEGAEPIQISQYRFQLLESKKSLKNSASQTVLNWIQSSINQFIV